MGYVVRQGSWCYDITAGPVANKKRSGGKSVRMNECPVVEMAQATQASSSFRRKYSAAMSSSSVMLSMWQKRMRRCLLPGSPWV